MSSVVSFGTNTNAQRKRVYFTGSITMYEGMPVCYDDSTTNVLGVDRYDGSASTTTTAGYLNEGHFLRVERPASDNVDRFAGVMAGGPKVGKTGPAWIDIFIPNGAVVPVRTDVSCTTDVTILAIADGEEELGAPTSATRPVAIARETLDSTDNRLILAELCPDKFLYLSSRGTALSMGAGTHFGTVDITTATTSLCWGPQFKMTNTGTGAGGMIGFRLTTVSEGTAIAGNVYGLWSQAELGTAAVLGDNKEIAGIWSKAWIPSDATTVSGDVYGIKISLGINKAIGGDCAFMMFDATTTAAIVPDYLFECLNEGNTVYQPNTTHAEDAKVGAIKIYIGSGAKYLWVYDGVA